MFTHPRILHLVALAAALACADGLAAETRQWTDRTGKFSVEAELVEVQNGSVLLRRADGSTATVPMDRLGEADRRYLKHLPGAAAEPRLKFPDALTEPPSWNDANSPFDLAAFLKGPPSEENAAPLYLLALDALEPMEMEPLLYPDLPREARIERRNASRSLHQQYTSFEEAWQEDRQSVDSQAVDAWLANYDAGFKLLADAQQRPKCQFQTGYSIHTLIPHVQASRQVARAIVWRTRRDLARGDLNRPLQDLATLLRLTRDLRVRGFAVSQFVAVAMDSVACDQVLAIISDPGITTDHCDRLLNLLSEHETKTTGSFAEGIRAEFIVARQALHDLQHRTGTFDPQFMRDELAIDGDTTSPLACFKFITSMSALSPEQQLAKIEARLRPVLLPSAWQGGKMLSDDDYAEVVASLNRYFASILDHAERAASRRELKTTIVAADAELKKATLASLVDPAAEGVLQEILRYETNLQGTRCLVALRRWQLEHDQPPPDLAALAQAAGMPTAPFDPFSGEPFRMTQIDGKTVIYSIGPDGKDDQAQVEWNGGPRSPGDYVFRLAESSP